jgi:DNA repair protein RadC
MKLPVKYVIRQRLTLAKESTTFPIENLTSPETTAAFMRKIYKKELCEINLNEYFYTLYLNKANQIIGYSKIGEGGYSGVVVDGKIIFSNALKNSNCHAIILVHNHPSGQNKPSDNDISLTRKLKNFGSMIDMQVIDHLIITKHNYYSFADNGIL